MVTLRQVPNKKKTKQNRNKKGLIFRKYIHRATQALAKTTGDVFVKCFRRPVTSAVPSDVSVSGNTVGEEGVSS